MKTVLRDLNYESCFVHLEVVIVIGRTFKGHLFSLLNILERFRKAHLQLNPEKCQLFQNEVRIFGALCHQRGYTPNSRN
jgi:hypothetical protein